MKATATPTAPKEKTIEPKENSPRENLLQGVAELNAASEKMFSEMPAESAAGTQLFVLRGSEIVLLAAELGAARSGGERRLLLAITTFGAKLDDFLVTAERDQGFEPIKPPGKGSALVTAFSEVVTAADEIDKRQRSMPPLEPVATLLEQKCTYRQIAMIYSSDGGKTSPFLDEWGVPDEAKIRAEAKESGSVLKDFVDPRLAEVRRREVQEDKQINSLQRLARIMAIRIEGYKNRSDVEE